MLYLRGLTLKNNGTAKKPNNYLVCSFSASTNKYAVTRNCVIWENSNEQKSAFNALCRDFNIDTEDEFVSVTADEAFDGEFFEETVAPHYVEINGERQKDKDGNDVISHTLRSLYCETFGETKEGVIKRYERQWAANNLLVPVTDEEQFY